MLKKSFALENPFSKESSITLSILQVILASCFIALCAQIKIPLYFTPIPFTTQSIAVMLVGALLGSRKGSLAVLCYLMQGGLGLPVFVGGAAGSLAYFFGPTGGYLLGYVMQSYLIGWFTEKYPQANLFKVTAAIMLSVVVQMTAGSLWLAQFVGIKRCFMLGFFPFIVGDAAKACLVATILKFRKKK